MDIRLEDELVEDIVRRSLESGLEVLRAERKDGNRAVFSFNKKKYRKMITKLIKHFKAVARYYGSDV